MICIYVVAPAINLEVMDEMKDEGDTAYFSCEAMGKPVPIISWYHNDVLVNIRDRFIISQSSFNITVSSTLIIMNVQSSDVGTYTCNVTNDTSSGVLTVNGELLLYLLSIVIHSISG